METVEEQNRPKIASKRIKFLQVMEEGKDDRLSALPDFVLLEILSRLPSAKYAIRTGTLSKRWKHLWTLVPTLIFKHKACKHVLSDFVSFVRKTLTQCRQLNLKKFQVYTAYDIRFESQVNNWIQCAIRCNVEELILKVYTEPEAEFHLDQSLYISSCFTYLRLSGCVFNPSGAISWKNLRSLCISIGKLDEDLVKNILSGSPQLETLELVKCYGYRRLDISSKSVKSLVFSEYKNPDDVLFNDDIIEINAPNILSLTIQGRLRLWKFFLLNVSSLVEAKLDYRKGGPSPTEAKEEMLKGIILNLLHLKKLKMGDFCFKVLSCLEAKGFVFASDIISSLS